ncbi:MAG: co-chaperone DjlA [Endozoicomonadaceae bacterium]|nr:co-chaperone DjlA [Endozoicomonadaceae bacterium]MCY4328507.1 co-chaperone DjlA [Endozoicomonadaceae bacterium]
MWAPVFLLAFSGLIFFGPVGAIMGGLFGFMLRKSVMMHHASAYRQNYHGNEVFFRAVFIAAGGLAKADGRVNEQEIQQVTQLMNAMNLTAQQRQQAITHFDRGKAADTNIEEILIQLQTAVHPQRIHLFIKILLQVACADGKINSGEENFLLRTCRMLNVSAFTLELLKRQARTQHFFYQQGQYTNGKDYSHHYNYQQHHDNNNLHEAYQLLGISKTASYEEAKRAYRKLMSQHHPDKFVKNKEKQQQAKQKTQVIQTAWNQVQQHLKSKT